MNAPSPTYSIIVPVYNAGATIKRCVESILNQEYRDWELILVDDGSKDDSLKLCEQYSLQDSRIRTLHQANSGPSAARNNGLSIARGTYVVFVDSDDWVESSFLSDYVDAGDEYDIVYQGLWKDWKNGEHIRINHLDIDTAEVPSAIQKLWEHDLFGYTCLKRFRRNIIANNNLQFNTQIFFREDTIFTAQYFQHVQKVRVLPVANYHYIYYESSLQHTRFNVKEMLHADNLIYEAFSTHFHDKAFKAFTEHWYLVNLHNGIKKSFVRENRRLFTDEERRNLIRTCIRHRHDHKFSGYQYSNISLLHSMLKVLWATENDRIIMYGLKWLIW